MATIRAHHHHHAVAGRPAAPLVRYWLEVAASLAMLAAAVTVAAANVIVGAVLLIVVLGWRGLRGSMFSKLTAAELVLLAAAVVAVHSTFAGICTIVAFATLIFADISGRRSRACLLPFLGTRASVTSSYTVTSRLGR